MRSSPALRQRDTAEAVALLREIIESRVAYCWVAIMYAGEPFVTLRGAEDLLVRMLLDSGDKAAAEQVYRDAIVRREGAEHPDRFQITFAKQRLGRFLVAQGNHKEAHEILMTAQDALADAPACFDWLQARVREDLVRIDPR